jgi:glycosyltransferase involved in cell wall biosynthesis
MTTAIVPSRILLISTFPPAKCGIASFAQDLLTAVRQEMKKSFLISVCALDKEKNAFLYDSPVTMLMDGHNLDSCIEAAAIINKDTSIELICIEHEFGLYGGELGEYLLGFLALLEKPFIIRLHTVLPAPDSKRLKVVQTIGLLADRIVVMTKNAARILQEDYQISPEKMAIIPHGTHPKNRTRVFDLKAKYKLKSKLVLTTFGLLSPNKGIEKGILAMKEISKSFPRSVYVIVGQTHPNLLEQEGEKYRTYLQQLIDDNNLQKNVRLVNEYVPTPKLMEYLALTDIYLFTSKDPYQAMSGTFLYAMSAGCPIISNSFVLAKEMLDEHTGIMLKGNDAQELAEQAIQLLEQPRIRKQMGYNAYLKTRDTAWDKVALMHRNLFCEVLGRPVARETKAEELSVND